VSRSFERCSGIPNTSDNASFAELLGDGSRAAPGVAPDDTADRAPDPAPGDPTRRTMLVAAPALSLGAAAALLGLPGCTAPSGTAGAVPGAAGAVPGAVPGPARAGRPLLGFKPIPISADDAVRVPDGYRADVLVAWGDPIGDARGMPAFRWDASNGAAEQELQSGTHHDGMSYFPLPLGSPDSAHGLLVTNHEYPDHALMFPDGTANWSLEKVRKSQAALGCSVQEIRLESGRWQLVRPSRFARRIHANTPMRVGGPAAGHALMRTAASPSGRESLGTFANCATGWTPWGTYLTCEENFNFYFRTPADPNPMEVRYELGGKTSSPSLWGDADPRFDMGRSRNEPNHFGWVVEFDPYDPASVPVKRTALGRFSHEGACATLCGDGRVAVYSGDDRAFEYIYKFVSARPMDRGDRAANRDLLDAGTLYVARFNADGSGDWLELTHGRNGLTRENGFDSQGAVAMFARAAADHVGATKMDRPEWIARHPVTGDLYCTLTNNAGRGQAGAEGATPANPRAPNRFGHIVRWAESGGECASTTFRWEVFVLAGDPNHADPRVRGNLAGDLFASPDGLMIDARGVIWVQTDISPNVLLKDDHSVYGNNQMLAVDPATREVRRFLTGPRGCEITGACVTPDGRTLFVNIQHPGEAGAVGIDPKNPRQLSNWPDFRPDGRPRSATVAVRRADGGVVGT
jgi:hypothetical protein